MLEVMVQSNTAEEEEEGRPDSAGERKADHRLVAPMGLTGCKEEHVEEEGQEVRIGCKQEAALPGGNPGRSRPGAQEKEDTECSLWVDQEAEADRQVAVGEDRESRTVNTVQDLEEEEVHSPTDYRQAVTDPFLEEEHIA